MQALRHDSSGQVSMQVIDIHNHFFWPTRPCCGSPMRKPGRPTSWWVIASSGIFIPHVGIRKCAFKKWIVTVLTCRSCQRRRYYLRMSVQSNTPSIARDCSTMPCLSFVPGEKDD